MWHFRKLTSEANALAIRCFEKAIAAYPQNAEAHKWRAACYANAWLNEFASEDLTNGMRQAVRAVEIDPTSASCHQVHGFCQLWLEGVEAAATSYRKALALNPGDPDVLIEATLLNVYAGDLSMSQNLFEQAFNLNPLPPIWYPEFRAIGVFVEGRYAEAFPCFAAIPDCIFDTMYAMACLGHLGDWEAAVAYRARYQTEGKKWDLLERARREPYVSSEHREHLVAGLEKALAF
jgi:tetratricopeptide (TPR) repeat protein